MTRQRSLYVVLAVAWMLITVVPAHAVTRWKIATVAPKGVGWAQQVQSLVYPWIEEATEGQLKLKIYWGGVMGNDEEYLQKMRIGQIDGAGISGAGSNQACAEFNVVGLPFLFNNFEEVDHIRKVMFPTFDYYFTQHGYKLFVWLDTDFDQCFSTKQPMDSVEAFKTSRIQTWFGPVEAETLKALGARPIPLKTMEGIAAYKTGIIDSSLMPVVGCIGTQLYTFVKYVNPMRIRYAPGCVIVNNEAWEKVPQQYRDNLDEGRHDMTAKFVSGTRAEAKIGMEAIIQYGVKLVQLDPETLADFKKRTFPVHDMFAGKLYPRELLDEVNQHLANFRQGIATDEPAPILAVALEKPVAAAPVVIAETEPVVVVAEEVRKVEKPAAPAVEATPAPVEVAVAAGPTPEELERERAAAALEASAKAYAEQVEAQKQAEARIKAQPLPKKTPDKKKQLSAWEKRRIQVRKVQEKLKPMGLYPSTIDGLYGPITRRGIIAFQKEKGLPQTGVIDDRLMRALGIKE